VLFLAAPRRVTEIFDPMSTFDCELL